MNKPGRRRKMFNEDVDEMEKRINLSEGKINKEI